jgi:hypothetical protein
VKVARMLTIEIFDAPDDLDLDEYLINLSNEVGRTISQQAAIEIRIADTVADDQMFMRLYRKVVKR